MGRPRLRQGEAAGKCRQRCASPAACGDPTTAQTHPARPDTPSVQRTASLEPDALQPLTSLWVSVTTPPCTTKPPPSCGRAE